MKREYIEREAAMNACKEAQIKGLPQWNSGLEDALERIKNLPAGDVEERKTAEVNAKRAMVWAAQGEDAMKKLPRWIPVTERLPEDGSDVLAYVDNSRITAVNYYKGTWQDCVMGRLYLTEEGFATHWMPLPEPPKEEEV